MKPSQGSGGHRNRTSRRSNLTLDVSQRTGAMPLPLPPPSALFAPPSSAMMDSVAPSRMMDSVAPSRMMDSIAPSSRMMDLVALCDLERLNRIGSGAGGTVYKVQHRLTQKPFALKVIYGNHDNKVRNQIHREIEILRKVDHQNVVRCYQSYDHNGDIQVLLEYMDGGSLEGCRITNESRLADVARQVLMGLAYLHSQRIVHRDIKPSNLLINNQNQIKIADFGVSRVVSTTMDPCNSAVGTIAYMSPERINTDLNHGNYNGHAGDIWSFGVSILEFYLGRFPFARGRQGDWASLMCAICMEEPPVAPSSASREFSDFISRCLQKDPTRRWTASRLLTHPFINRTTIGGNSGNHNKLLPPPSLPSTVG